MNGANGTSGSGGRSEDGGLHGLLCAYVLDELEGEERATIERALEESAELRAERERIAATIALVRDACGGGESVPSVPLERLQAAAAAAPAPAPMRTLWDRTPVRMAAGFAAVALGLTVGRAMVQRDRAQDARRPATDLSARHDDPGTRISGDGAESRRRGESAPDTRSAGLAFGEVASRTKHADAGVLPSVVEKAPEPLPGVDPALEWRETLSANARSTFSLQGQAVLEAQRGKLEKSGYAGGSGGAGGVQPARDGDAYHVATGEWARFYEDGAKPADSFGAGFVGAVQHDAARQPAGEAVVGGILTDELRLELAHQGLAPGQPAEADPEVLLGSSYEAGNLRARVSPEASTGSDVFFLGADPQTVRGAGLAQAQTRAGEAEKLGRLGLLREDPGGGPAAPGPSGPSSPGPSGPSTGAPGGAPGPRELSSPSAGAGGGPAAPAPPASAAAAGRKSAVRTETATVGGPHGGGGSYVGPGDTLPPVATLGETRRAGRDRSADARSDAGDPAVRRLRSLGYLGDDDGRADEEDERVVQGEHVPATPAEIDALVQTRVARLLQGCRRQPNERPSAMFFRFWGDNPFTLTQLDRLSTFSIDCDTASYALSRRYLTEGYLPEKAQVRTEEFVNYFDADVPAPTEETFAIRTELAPSRFGHGADDFAFGGGAQRWMLRVAVRGKEVSRDERTPLALTFVVDTSGSMKENDRLELVKHAMRLLVAQLDGRDSLALVAFSREARVVLPPTSAANRGLIEAAIHGLTPDGGTNAEAGLKVGYELALGSLSSQSQSRVVFLSDGVANVGQTDQDRLNADVRRHREKGVFLNTIGVGMGNHNDAFLEQLADKGDGLCNYVDSAIEARRALVENFTGAFQPIARDVKIQVEFDPAQVVRYRQLGYENRAIADADFRNDAVDAGEVGAGHQVVALYELELAGGQYEGPLGTVRLRWKQPTGAGRDPLEDSATEVEQPFAYAQATSWEGASEGYKRSVLVAQFAEILRRSVWARGESIDELIAESRALEGRLGDADFTDFVAMLERARQLIGDRHRAYDQLSLCLDAIRRERVKRAELECLERELGRKLLQDYRSREDELEARIRDLVRVQVEQECR